MPRHKSNQDSLERRVIETPTLSRIDLGIVNEGFDSISSPSFFYVEDSTSWIDPRRNDHKRFTESWIELDRAYSCGSSTGGAKRCKDRLCSCCCTFSCAKVGRIVAYLLVALSVIGFAAIISAILYMEIFHKFDYEWHPLKDTSVFSDHRHTNRTLSYIPPEEGPTVILPAAASPSPASASKETIVSSTTVASNSSTNTSSANSTTSSPSEPVASIGTARNSVTSPSPSPSSASTSSSNIINASTSNSISTTAGYTTHKSVNVTIAPKPGTNAPVNVTSS